MHHTLFMLSDFWRQFCDSRLYDLGFGDAVEACGADRADTRRAAVQALCFMSGAAYTARLGNEFLTPAWQAADLVHMAAGVLLTVLDSTADRARLEALTAQYTRELQALQARMVAA